MSDDQSQGWLAVASADHVAIGVAGGFAQVCHGRRGPLARMKCGDTIVYYSAGQKLSEANNLKSFAAIGTITDDVLTQVTLTSDFSPWRRSVVYEPLLAPIAIQQLKATLELTSNRNWGYSLRSGLIPLSPADTKAIKQATNLVMSGQID